MTYISSILAKNRKHVKVWVRNKKGRVQKRFETPYYFYIQHDKGTYSDIYGVPLKRLDYDNAKDFFDARKSFQDEGIKLFESDISPDLKVLSENFYGADIGNLNITFFDIEVDYDKDRGFSFPTNPYAPVSSVALYHVYSDRTIVIVVPPSNLPNYSYEDLPDDIKNDAEVIICEDETELLKAFYDEIEDSDIISGWNSAFFDVPYIYERSNLVLYKGAGKKLCFEGTRDPYYRDVEMYGNINKKLCLHGRVSLDYLEVYKKFEVSEKPSYKLEHVAEEELPHLPKIAYQGSLYDLYRNNFEEFVRYNLRDTLILKGLEEKKKYIALAIQMSHMATSQIDSVLGTIKIAEMSIINYCHYDLDKQVPDHHPPEDTGEKYGGATVIDPKAGLHSWVASLDLASLYPSTMRSLNISPETIAGQFMEKYDAFDAIRKGSDKKVTFVNEETGRAMREPAYKWKRVLKGKNWTISGAGTVFHQNQEGVVPSILTTWFSERKEFKKKMWEAAKAGDDAQREYYDRMQFIKKIQLNAMYGACGNRFFKFFDVRLAESTTLSGREILYHMAKRVAEYIDGEYNMESDCIIYGDTDSVYFSTYQETKEEALKVANLACDYVNSSYPDFMENNFNCDEKHRVLQKAEQEIVSDNGLFIKKKYYILHLVYDEGEAVDKIKDMGVPIKKTTLPKEIKNKLRSYIERLLKGESWDIIGPEVVYFKDELKENKDILTLGLPKGIKNLETYTDNFNSDPTINLPGGHAAAIMWNKCLSSYNDLESPRITSGSKMYTFYLTKKIGRFKSIAVPKDIDVLPDWFIEHFEPIIDRNAQILRLVDRPMEIMISVAGIAVPTKKKLKLEEGLFE